MVGISVGIAAGLIVLSIIGVIIAGAKSLVQSKQDYKKMAMMAVPFIVFGISYAVFGEFAKAGIFTTVFMLGAMIIAILLTGIRGTFKF